MTHDAIDLLEIDRGCVTAPAGCGKTHLIAQALTRHNGPKPVLILTHTNAGVAALRARMNNAGVPSGSYRLSTIDGWSIKLASTFPVGSGCREEVLTLSNPAVDYPAIRASACQLLNAGHIDDILAASYSRIIVDEYQDCSMNQHTLIALAAHILPTVVLGDPLQAIFNFGSDRLARWQEDVCGCFPVVGELATPWRWINAHSQPLGEWLLVVRHKLLRREPIDIQQGPEGVSWVPLDGQRHRERMLAAGRVQPPSGVGSVLIIGNSKSRDSQQLFARQTPGAVTVEAVDLRDLIQFSASLDITTSDALARIAEFAESVMTNVGAADLLKRVESLSQGTARKAPSAVEACALAFVRSPSYAKVRDLLVEMGKEGGVRTHRPAVLKACLRALNACSAPNAPSFQDATLRVREQNRVLGRPLPRRAVGSTLLLKGLEAEVAVLLEADAWDAKNLYVAMTRGSKLLTICSRTAVLDPR